MPAMACTFVFKAQPILSLLVSFHISYCLILEGCLGGSGLACTLRALPGSTGTAPQACGQCTGKAREVLGLLAGRRFDSRLYDLCVGFQLGAVDGNPELLLARRGERVAVYNVQRPEMRGLQLARGYVSRLHGALFAGQKSASPEVPAMVGVAGACCCCFGPKFDLCCRSSPSCAP